jgi:hypothetical protein
MVTRRSANIAHETEEGRLHGCWVAGALTYQLPGRPLSQKLLHAEHLFQTNLAHAERMRKHVEP